MADSIMYQEEGFVLLETGQEEQILTAEELKEKLTKIVISQGENLPRELNKFNSLEEKIEHLISNYYELDLGPGEYVQWYVIRLEK